MPQYNLSILVDGKDNGASSVLRGISGMLGDVGKTAAGILTANVFGQLAGKVKDLAVGSISAAGDFQAGMNDFQVAVGKTIDGSGKSLVDFKNLFIQLGKDLPVSTSEVQQAATEMARGGIDPATIAADGLKRTIQFAAAALDGDLVSAAQISAKTMQAWTSITDSASSKTDFLAHAQNMLTQATTAASTTVDQLFLGLSNVGGTARLAGVSFDETVTALAQLTPSFASSADAGTSFKTMLARLQPTTKAAFEEMQSLHLLNANGKSAFYDAQGNFVGMAKAADLLRNSTKNLSSAEKERALQTLFGQDAIRAAAVFAAQGAQGYNAIAESISKQTNVTDAAAIKQSGYNTALENFKGSVEALQISLGSHLLPILTSLLSGPMAGAVNAITDFGEGFFAASDKVGYLKTAFTGLAASAGQWISQATPGVLASLKGMGQQLVAWVGAQAPIWGAAFGGWIRTTAIPFLQTNLPIVARAVTTWIGAQLPGLKTQFISWGTTFGTWIQGTALPYLATNLPLVVAAVNRWITAQMPAIKKQLFLWGVQFGAWVTADAIPALVTKLPMVWLALTVWSGQLLYKISSLLLPAGMALVEGLWGGIQRGWPALKAKFGAFLAGLAPTANSILQINSPSKVFMPTGSGIPEGLGVGIDRGAPIAHAALAKLGAGLAAKKLPGIGIGAFSSALSSGGGSSPFSLPRAGSMGGGNRSRSAAPIITINHPVVDNEQRLMQLVKTLKDALKSDVFDELENQISALAMEGLQ